MGKAVVMNGSVDEETKGCARSLELPKHRAMSPETQTIVIQRGIPFRNCRYLDGSLVRDIEIGCTVPGYWMRLFFLLL